MGQDEPPVTEQVDQLLQVRPVWAIQGHEVCADVHLALSVAQAVLTSRDERVGDLPAERSGDALLRELRALGVKEAPAHLIAMVAVVEAAVDRLADLGAMDEAAAWEQLRKDVLHKHCQSPDTL